MEITEKAPAKLNLLLDTPFCHKDGHLEWQMAMTAIDLADYIHIKVLPHNDQITVETDNSFLPCDQRNLTYQAAKKIKNRFNIKSGLQISIKKNIPVAAGMGGGSTDAAAVLRGLNKIWDLSLTKKELAQLGLTIDSDVPFCVYSQPALVTGRGENITPLGLLPPMWFVIAKPPTSVSTPFILKQVDYDRLGHLDVNALTEAVRQGDYNKLTENMGNVLEPITTKHCPQIARIKNKMLQFGAQAAIMSGTGPTIYGVCQKYSRAVRVYNSLRGFCDEVYLVQPFSLHSPKF